MSVAGKQQSETAVLLKVQQLTQNCGCEVLIFVYQQRTRRAVSGAQKVHAILRKVVCVLAVLLDAVGDLTCCGHSTTSGHKAAAAAANCDTAAIYPIEDQPRPW